MDDSVKLTMKAKSFPIWAALIFSISVVVMVAWKLEIAFLINLGTESEMQFNTAFCFAALSAAYLFQNTRPIVYRGGLLVVFVFAATTLIEYLTGTDTGLDSVFQGASELSDTSRMSIVTAICFIASSVPAFIPTRLQLNLFTKAFFPAIVLSICSAAMIGYLADLPTAYSFINMGEIAPHTAISFLLYAAFTLRDIFSEVKTTERLAVVSSIVFIGFMMTLALAASEKLYQRSAIVEMVENDFTQLDLRKTVLEENLGGALQRMAKRFTYGSYSDDAIWRQDVRQYVQTQHELLFVSWTLPDQDIAWVSPRVHESTNDRLTSQMAEIFPLGLGNGEPVWGTKGVLLLTNEIVLPVVSSATFENNQVGYITGFISLNELLATLSNQLASLGYQVSVLSDGITVYKSPDQGAALYENSYSRTINLYNQAFKFTLTPHEELIRESFGAIIIIVGSCLTILFGITFYFYLLVRSQKEVIQKSSQNLEDTFLEMNVAILGISHAGTIEIANQAVLSMFKYELSELQGQSIDILVPERVRGRHPAHRKEFMSGTNQRLMEDREDLLGLTRDGDEIPMKIGLNRVQNSDNLAVVLTIVDLRDRKEAERKLSEQRIFLNNVLERSLAGLYIFNFQTNSNTFINPAYTQITGYTLEDLQEINDRDGNMLSLFHPEDQELVADHIQQILKSSKPQGQDLSYRFRHKDGHWIWCYSRDSVYSYDKDGGAKEMLGTFFDATELKRTELALAETNKELQQFAYAASHDLKAPMRSIRQLAKWIHEEIIDAGIEMSDDLKQYIGLLEGRIDRLQALLESLLEYSRIGRSGIVMKPIETRSTLEEICHFYQIDEKFSFEFEGDFPTIETDSVAFRQTFMNLISNAIKHHDQETGTITISYIADTSEHYHFIVTDDGPGIPLEFHEKVFGMFQTLKPRDEVEGSGMGLALVKKNIDAFGGRIKLVSDASEQRGTSFHVFWPKRITQDLIAINNEEIG